MQLLTTLLEDSLDQGYAEAAARRATAGENGDEPRPASRRLLVGLALVVVGALLATAAAATRERSGSAERTRTALAEEIREREAANDRREADLERQRLAVTRSRERALRRTEQGSQLSRRLALLETATGVSAVVGPGLSLRLEDAPESGVGPNGDPRTEEEIADGRVTDRDLQTVVNELWAAGAEAVAVDGQRLTALTAIRTAGDAILVDFRPLVPPYDVVAVGSPDLAVDLLSGFGGAYLDELTSYGIAFQVDEHDQVEVPGAVGVTLREATTTAGRIGSGPTAGSTGGGSR